MPHHLGHHEHPDRTELLSVTALPVTVPGRVVVEVAGEVDSSTAPVLDACLRTQTGRPGVGELAVDLQRVTFLGASGVTVLAQAQRRCRIRGARLVLRVGPGPALTTLRLVGPLDGTTVDPAEQEPAQTSGARRIARSRTWQAPARRPRSMCR